MPHGFVGSWVDAFLPGVDLAVLFVAEVEGFSEMTLSEFREQMCSAIVDLTRMAESDDREAFAELFSGIGGLLGDSAADLSEFAARIVEATRRQDGVNTSHPL